MSTVDRENIEAPASRDSILKRRLLLSIAFTGVIFIAELAGGYMFNSLALMSDSLHVFMDAFALILSLVAIYISELPPTGKRTFGLHRVEVFVSFINSFTLLIITLFIFYKAYGRVMNPQPVESMGTLAIGFVGLVVNVVVALRLRRFASSDLNIKSAFLHVLGDAVASVGVIASAIIIYYTGWYVVDPIISFMIGAIIFYGVANILRDASHILLEGVPKDIDINDVVRDLNSIKGVSNMHRLHVWSICNNVYALSAHIDIEPAERRRMGEIFKEANEMLAERYHIFYTTLQAECLGCDSTVMLEKLSHRERGHVH
ncbi:MAG: cation diffusion facilitator family transporter [Thermodesulfobacteriota bacterium]|nr:MAG: cation diffusion facilitator family transporter [Thermodesulfobacteriota bacterium]